MPVYVLCTVIIVVNTSTYGVCHIRVM